MAEERTANDVSASPAGQPAIGFGDRARPARRATAFSGDPPADLRARPRERGDVLDIEWLQELLDAISQAVLGEEFAKGGGRRREAAGHADARAGKLADHLAERGVLAADLVDVGHAQVFEPDDSLLLPLHWSSLPHG